MVTGWRHEAIDAVLVRLAVQPATLVEDTRIDLDPDDADAALAYLRERWADPLLREAVHVSSTSLARDLDRIAEGYRPEPRSLRRSTLALTRYALRAATRPTPFGLLAGVTAGEFGAEAKSRLGTRHRRVVSVDLAWLVPLIRSWEGRPEVLRGLWLVANNLCQQHGERLTLAYRQAAGETPEEPTEMSIRRTPVVGQTLALARVPIRYGDLVDGLVRSQPGAAPERVARFVAELVGREILLTDLRPPPDAVDPLGHVLARVPADFPERADLERVRDLATTYAATPVGAGLPAWRQLTGAMAAVRRADRLVHVDVGIDADVRLPRIVADEVTSVVNTLGRLMHAERAAHPLDGYHREFLDRYGVDALVPLVELLDAERGLGPPATYARPAGFRTVPRSEQHNHAHHADRVITRLAADAVRTGAREIVLDDALLTRLAGPDPVELPPCVEVYAHLLAPSLTAVEAGEFSLVLGPMSGARGHVGMTWGRFLPLLGVDAPPLAALTPGPAAEVVGYPVSPRVANVVRVPPQLPARIPVGVFHDPADPSTLSLDDLYVGADDTRLFLVSRSGGGPVHPVAFHMLSEHVIGSNEARFLRDLANAWTVPWKPWRWGAAETLPYLPRVRLGRTIIQPAAWWPDPELAEAGLSGPQWQAGLDAWRDRWAVPARVQVVIEDHRIELDLDRGLQRQVFRDQLRRGPGTLVRESPYGGGAWSDALGWSGGHCAELVVTTVRRPPAPQPRSGTVTTARPRHQPGGEWLYAKLYASERRHGELLATHLGRLVAALGTAADRWFFVRYADPEPHLRLRLHAASPATEPVLRSTVHDWAEELCRGGAAARLVLDCYEPEVDRYGGPAAMNLAEEVFSADSVAALHALATLNTMTDIPPSVLAAAGAVDLARHLLGEGWDEWLLHRYQRGAYQAAFREVRAVALRTVDPDGGWAGLGTTPDGTRLLAAWRHRADRLAAYAAVLAAPVRERVAESLLHMHHNRLVGVDPVGELRMYAIARGAVQTHRDRRKHRRDQAG